MAGEAHSSSISSGETTSNRVEVTLAGLAPTTVRQGPLGLPLGAPLVHPDPSWTSRPEWYPMSTFRSGRNLILHFIDMNC